MCLGDITLYHGNGNVTQFANTNGTVTVNKIEQDGYASGSLVSVAVTETGRSSGTYSNGKTVDLFQVTLAKFSNPEGLQRIDGTAFQATDSSGNAIMGASGAMCRNRWKLQTSICRTSSQAHHRPTAYTANRVITTATRLFRKR